MDNNEKQNLIDLYIKNPSEYYKVKFKLVRDGKISIDEHNEIRITIKQLKEEKDKKIKKNIIRFSIGIGVVTVFWSVFLLKYKGSKDVEPLQTAAYEVQHEPISYKAPTDIPTPTNIPTSTPTPTVTIAPTEIPEVKISFEFEDRMKTITEDIKVGSKVEKELLKKLTPELLEIFNKYGEIYGIDPYLLVAKCMQESRLNPNADNGYAVGISQIEKELVGSKVSAYNYVDNTMDTETITDEKRKDIDSSIRLGAMILSERIAEYGNIYLAIQAYNYGETMINSILKHYCSITGLEKEEVLNNIKLENIMDLIQDGHKNPNKYIKNWQYKTYGDADYVSNVFNYMVGTKTYYNYNGKTYIIDLCDCKIIETEKIEGYKK